MTLTWTHRKCSASSRQAASSAELLLMSVHWCELQTETEGMREREAQRKALMMLHIRGFTTSSVIAGAYKVIRLMIWQTLVSWEKSTCCIPLFCRSSLFVIHSYFWVPSTMDYFKACNPYTAINIYKWVSRMINRMSQKSPRKWGTSLSVLIAAIKTVHNL